MVKRFVQTYDLFTLREQFLIMNTKVVLPKVTTTASHAGRNGTLFVMRLSASVHHSSPFPCRGCWSRKTDPLCRRKGFPRHPHARLIHGDRVWLVLSGRPADIFQGTPKNTFASHSSWRTVINFLDWSLWHNDSANRNTLSHHGCGRSIPALITMYIKCVIVHWLVEFSSLQWLKKYT